MAKSKAIRKFSDLEPARVNANKGTPRGTQMVENSLRKYGAGRSILIDRKGRVIAGNHVVEGAASIGLDDIIVVPTDGRKLVVVQRTDLDLDEIPAREMAIADNRTSEIGLQWDADVLASLAAELNLDHLFNEDELKKIIDTVNGEGPEASNQNREKSYRLERSSVDCPHCRQTFTVIVDKDRHVIVDA